MLEQLIVTTHDKALLKPLLQVAIQSELKSLEIGLRRTQERLAEFEQRFSMVSAEFERRFLARELNETLDFIEWLGEIKMLRLLERKLSALKETRID